MSQTRAYLHFKQALVLIEEQLFYISLDVSRCWGQQPPCECGADAPHKAAASAQPRFIPASKIFFNICLFVFISFTLMHTLVIFFLPPTINLISQLSSRSFFSLSPNPPLPVQAEMREDPQIKGEEEELKQDAKIKCTLTVFDCLCTIFLEWI